MRKKLGTIERNYESVKKHINQYVYVEKISEKLVSISGNVRNYLPVSEQFKAKIIEVDDYCFSYLTVDNRIMTDFYFEKGERIYANNINYYYSVDQDGEDEWFNERLKNKKL